jgi:uncharacterized protein (TIGR00251 family)
MIFMQDQKGGKCMKINVKVTPQAGRQKIILDKSGSLKCYLNSPPEDGKANRELIKLFADVLNIPQKEIEIVQGLISRSKVLDIPGFYSLEQLYEALGLQIQRKIF